MNEQQSAVATLSSDDKRKLLARLLRQKAQDSRSALSAGQLRLWFLEQMDPGNPIYNLAVVVRLRGELDRATLERSLSTAVERHEVLRTGFIDVEGVPYRSVSSESVVSVPSEDLGELDEGQRLAEARSRATREARQPFEVSRAPLVRARLYRLGDDDHLLMLAFHRLVMDEAGAWVLVRELLEHYRALQGGESASLPEVEGQFAEVVPARQERMEDELERHLGFWRRTLDDLPILDLQTDRSRPQSPSFRGSETPLGELSEETVAALRELAEEEGADLEDALLATYAVFLSRISGEPDLAVGVVDPNRSDEELAGLLGRVENMVVRRVSLGRSPSLREVVGRVRRQRIDSAEHDGVPFERLVNELSGEHRDTTRSPLFQVAFSYRDGERRAEIDGLEATMERLPLATSDYELTLLLRDVDGGVDGSLEYASDLFDDATAERLAAHLRRLVEAAAEVPDAPISTLPLLSEDEKRRILDEWASGGEVEPEESLIHEMLSAAAREHRKKLAVICGEERLAYETLESRSNRLARELVDLGVSPEDRVGICVDPSVEVLVALLGVWKAGAAFVPLDPSDPDERLSFLVRDADVRTVVTRSRLQSRLEDLEVDTLNLDELSADDGSSEAPRVAMSPDNAAYVLYTSGSTGRPKGVVVHHRHLVGATEAGRRYFAEEGPEITRFLMLTPFVFDGFLGGTLWTLSGGGTLVLPQEGVARDVGAVSDLIARHGVSHMTAVLSLCDMVLSRSRPEKLASLRAVMVGGEACHRSFVENHRKRFPGLVLFNAYGPTEATVWSTCHRVEGVPPIAQVPIGKPIRGAEVYLLDERMEPVPSGVPGEMYLGGRGVTRGYLGRPELTAERFCPSPWSDEPGARLYRTGDLARYTADGSIVFLRRVDEQVKVRGYRLEPGEIEAVLETHPVVEEAVVIVREDTPGDRRLVAYVTVRDGEPSLSELRRFVGEKLPEYMIPSAVVLLEDALPRTASGKIDRRGLPAPDGTRPELESSFVAPRNEVERELEEIYQSLLRVERIGVHDSFFDLGGDSLMFSQLFSKVYNAFEVEIRGESFFQDPTISGLSRMIDVVRREEQASALASTMGIGADTMVGSDLDSPLSFGQERQWFLEQLARDNPVYHSVVARRARGGLDLQRLKEALSDVVERHEILRTTFVPVDGRPFPVVSASLDVEPTLSDLQSYAETVREEEAARLMTEEARRPFHLSKGPLLRLAVVHLDDDDDLILLTLHRIVGDERAAEIVIEEVAARYSGEPLESEPMRYADYVARQREDWQEKAESDVGAYWREELEDVPALSLGTDRPRPIIPSFRGAEVEVELSEDLTDRARDLASDTGAETSDLMLAAYQVLLARYSGQTDFAVGIQVPGRTEDESRLVGLASDIRVLRVRLDEDPSFRQVLADVVRRRTEAEDQAIPFEKLLQELQPERDRSRNPIFQVGYSYDEDRPETLRFGDGELEPARVSVGTSEFDLSLHLEDGADRIAGHLEYATDLFERPTIEAMARHFRNLLGSLLESPELPISGVELLSDEERERLLVEWNDSAAPIDADTTIDALFQESARERGSATAVVCGDRELTYEELDRRASALALELQEKGLGVEERVGIYLERSVDFVVALLGIARAGCTYVPFSLGDPMERLAFLMDDADVSFVVSREELVKGLPEREIQLLDIDALPVPDDPPEPERRALPEHAAYVIYTSGSTGRPKGVVVSHRNIVHSTRARIERLYSERDTHGMRALLMPPFVFDASGADIYGTLCSGGMLVIPTDEQHRDVAAVTDLIVEHGINQISVVPSFLKMLLTRARPGQLDSLEGVVVAGEPFLRELVERREKLLPNATLFNEYGPTEGTIWTTIYEVPDELSTPQVPIGSPIPNARTYVLDGSLRLVPPGSAGELCFAGPGLARGYLERPAITAERFVPDPFGEEPGGRLYRSGDLVRHDRDGELVFVGRVDSQVKVRGYRIELGEVELVLEGHPDLREVAVTVDELAPGELRLAAYATTEPDAEEPSTTALREYLGERLPEYMIPAVFVMLESMPRTATGKLDRGALPELDSERPKLDTGYVAPRTPEEEDLASIFSNLLGVDQVGVHDNFFELGGDSLLFSQLFTRMTRLFEVDLHVTSTFQEPTVARLLRAIEDVRQAGRRSADFEFAVMRDVDLEGEAVLDPVINPEGALPLIDDVANPSQVFITGATGFLGAFLLDDLLEVTDADVHCLVRAPSDAAAGERLRGILEHYKILDEEKWARVRPVAGDLAKPLLGLTPERFQELAETVEVIYHSGALVNFSYPYSVLKGPNVLGTQEVLRLACRHRVKAMHYISTIDVFLSPARRDGLTVIREEDALRSDGVPPGYVQSKWVAEQLVRIARSRGLPSCIYRPLQITGESKTGVFHETDAVYLFMKGYIQSGIAPEMELFIDAIPVDWVSRAMIYLSRQKESLGKIYHFANRHRIHFRELIKWTNHFGYSVRQIPYPEWRKKAMHVEPDNALYPFVPVIPEEHPTPENMEPGVDCTNTWEGLEGSGLECPPLDNRLLRVYADHLVEMGFLDPPPEGETPEPYEPVQVLH